ncbi:MAG: PilZ domain-containing protein [Deltaproteobacteria bacterium]|nr:PilZ domain-containing protein [Deltaproteobacteria bacterium]
MTEKRQFERAVFDDTVAVEHAGQRFDARVRDLSVGGAYVLTDRRLAFGQPVTLTFRLPALAERGKPPVVIEGVVRWVRDDGFGVQFGPTGAIATWALADYVARKNHGL